MKIKPTWQKLENSVKPERPHNTKKVLAAHAPKCGQTQDGQFTFMTKDFFKNIYKFCVLASDDLLRGDDRIIDWSGVVHSSAKCEGSIEANRPYADTQNEGN